MSRHAFDELKRYRKLMDLSNVVLLDNEAAASSRDHLEEKIRARVEKEFRDATDYEREIIEGIKEENLRFVGRKLKRFRSSEYFVQIKNNVREKDVHLFYKFPHEDFSPEELHKMGDACKRAGVRSVTVYMPFIPDQRQDKKDDGRVPISAKLFFDLLATSFGSYLKRIVTTDLHASQAQAHFDGPLDELRAVPEFAAYYKDKFKDDFRDGSSGIYVFSPDAGGAKRARYLAKLLGVASDTFDKRRIGHGEAETKFPPLDFVKGKKVIIVDDMIDSGSSLVGEYENDKIGPVQYLQSKGADVYVCATHAIMSEKNGISAEERMRQAGVPVLFTDSLPEPEPGYFAEHKEWMSIISLDYALAKAWYCSQVGESISAFMERRESVLQGSKLDFLTSDGSNGLVDFEGE